MTDDLKERIARAWASIDGHAEAFDRGKSGDDEEGRYEGYLAEAEELIKRAELTPAVAETPTCIHMTAEMAENCPTCNPGLPPSPDTQGAVQEAARVLLADFEKSGDQRSREPSVPWQDVFRVMRKERSECGWEDWPAILTAALRAIEGER